VSVTPTFEVWHCSKWLVGGLIKAAVLAELAFTPALAAETSAEKDSGFFSYFPAPPDINLPNLDIFHLWTSDLKIGRKAYNSGNYDKALKYFRKSSEDGNSVADWYLGHMYRLGRGVRKNPAVAYSYYSRVAESYDPDDRDAGRLRIIVDSQLHLTSYTQQGLPDAGIKANPEMAAKNFLRIASNYGHPRAMFELGKLNLLGNGVKQNPQQGLKWLISAARKRDVLAEAYLGDLYWTGNFVRRDETRALMWYVLATESAPVDEFSEIFQRQNKLRSEVDEDVRLEADARARVWAEQYPIKKRD
jgi:uncharacterized protein